MPEWPATDLPVWQARILDAAATIGATVRRTGLRPAAALTGRLGVDLWLKPENHQITGSFKLRGVTNALALLPPEARARGVVTASTGNHGRALAHAATAAGTRASVFVSGLVPANKLAALREAGADLHIVGTSQDEAEAEARRHAAEHGQHFIPPFDDPAVIAGQGTIGVEILADLPEVAQVLVPLSGGGLAAGVAAAVKAQRPACRVIGVSMRAGAAMAASLESGRPVEIEEVPTLADSLGGGIGLENRFTFAMVRDLLDDIVLLSEPEIADGIRVAAAEGEVVEGAGAVGLGALAAGRVRPIGPMVALLSGGNIDPELHRRIVAAEAA